jgi:tripartite-type tricarboxylate transporter receptor subunit TctC
LQLAAGAAALPVNSHFALAQTYPERPITMIVPFAPGGTIDVIGRLLAERMRRSLAQPIIVENISGADGSTGTARAAKARADGYTIVTGNLATHVMNGAAYSLSYDVLNDFAPIAPLTESSILLFARKAFPANDVNELTAWLKANPNKTSAGVYTPGTRLLSLSLQREIGVRFGLVPYRGAPPAMQDLAAGQIDLLFAPLDWLSLVRAGSIKAFAATSDTRLALTPDIPTFAEMALPALSYSSWYGLFAPRGTPNVIVSQLRVATAEALADPAVRSRLADIGQEVFPPERQNPAALGALQKADAEKWWPLIKEFGIKPE